MGTLRMVEDLALEFGDGVGPWTTALSRRAMSLARPGPRGADGISFAPEGFDALHQVASIRLGLAMAVGDVSALSPAERALVVWCARARHGMGTLPRSETETLRRILDRVEPLRAPPAAAEVPHTFGFGFAWARESGAGTSATAGRGYARMVAMDAADAPVACRLATPDEGALEVRRDAVGFLRPVTSPGTWEPVGIADFLDAAWSGARWADNPFMPARRDMPVLTLAEAALSGRDGTPSRQAAAALVASVGDLVAIGGTVHRRCPPPEACVTRDRRRGPARVTWRIPGQVEATDDMGCLRLDQYRVLRLDPVDPTGAPFHAGTEHAPLATLPLTEVGTLAGMASRFLGGGVEPAASGFEVVAPEAWRDDPARPLASLAGWARAVPDAFRGEALRGACAALDAALADWGRHGRLQVPDTSAAEAEVGAHSPGMAAWGGMLRGLAEAPVLDDAGMAGFAP